MSFRSDASETSQFSILVVIVLVIVSAGIGLIGLARLGFMPWAVEYERRIFEESRSHVDGTNLLISRMWLDHEGAKGAQRNAIRGMICTQSAQVAFTDLTELNRAHVAQICKSGDS